MEKVEIVPLKSDELEHLQKVEILPKFDQLEYLQLRKIFRQIGKFSTFQLFRKKREIFPIKSYIGTFAGEEFQINQIIFQFPNFLTKI